MMPMMTMMCKIVEETAQKVLDQPEVRRELENGVEANIRDRLPEEVRRRTQEYLQSYDSGVRSAVKRGVDAWIEAHLLEIKTMIDKAADKACHDENIYNEVAKCQFSSVLSMMADAAVAKALVKSAKSKARRTSRSKR